MANRDQVIEWLRANGWRYGAAAKQFGVDKDQVKAWGRAARGLDGSEPASRASAPASAPDVGDLVGLARVDFLEWQLDQALADLEALQGQEKASTAISSMHRTVRELRDALDEERTKLEREGELGGDLSPEEHAAAIRQEIFDAPEAILEVIEAAIEERRNPVRLVR